MAPLQQLEAEIREQSPWFTYVMIALGVIIFLIIAWVIARKLLSNASDKRDAPRSLQRESISTSNKKSRRAVGLQSGGVRAAYRKYLSWCKEQGIPVDGSVASDVIRDRSAPYAGAEDTAAIRALWLPARYSDANIPSEDAKRARQLVRRMRDTASKARRSENKRMK